MTTDKELKILESCIRRNRCEGLVEQYWNLVCSTVRKTFRVKNAPIANDQVEDICQEVFFQLLDDDRRRLRRFTPAKEHSLARWIVVIATHTTLNFLRKHGYDSFMGQNGRTEVDEDFRAQGDIERAILNKVTVDSALQVISHIDRIVIKLYRLGVPAKDIGLIIDSSEAAVNNRISRIKKTLSEFIDYQNS